MFTWLIDRKLAVGSAPRTYDVLVPHGFTAALNLQEDSEPGPARGGVPADFSLARVPIRDGVIGGKPTEEQLRSAVESLRALLDERTVYVHCFAGVGRSPLVCIAYLVRHRGMAFLEAFQHVSHLHPRTAPTESQLEVCYRYLRSECPERL